MRTTNSLLIIALCTLMPLTAEASLLYWGDNAYTINRANTDGTDQQQLLSVTRPMGMSIDDASGTLYYTDWNYKIWTSDLDGNNATVLKVTSNRPIDVDLGGGRIWWIDHGPVVDTGPVRSSLLDGSDETAVATEYLAHEIEYNEYDNRTYFFSGISSALFYTTDGTDRNWARSLYGGANNWTLNSTTNDIYWNSNNKIHMDGLYGPGSSSYTTIVSGVKRVTDLLVDEINEYLYWSGQSYTDGNGIWRADLDGGNVVKVIDTGIYTAEVLALSDSQGIASSVPLPSAWALLLGTLPLLRRR